MTAKRLIQVYTAACPACDDGIAQVNAMACPCCDVQILDMRDPAIARRAKDLGVHTVPAVVIDGKLATCCTGNGPDALHAAGIGQPR